MTTSFVASEEMVSPHSPIQAARILLIEDDHEVSNSLASVLEKKGYFIQQRFNGKDGLLTAINQKFHLIVLDKMLPQLDGLELLRRLRKYRDTPVMMLSACGAEQDRIAGFSGGADDYLPKPFNLTELLLRIEALLRRSMHQDIDLQTPGILSDAELNLDLKAQTLAAGDQVIELTPIEFELLKTFFTHKYEVLSKAYLYQLVLKKPFSRYDRSLDMHVSNLRSKMSLLQDTQRIKTVRGQGYSFQ